MIDKQALSPDKVVLDLVLQWGSSVQQLCAAPLRFLIIARNHRGQRFQQIIEAHLDGAPEDGPPVRFLLYRIAPTVWKLAPSLYVPGLVHSYLTFVGVPEPAPWASA